MKRVEDLASKDETHMDDTPVGTIPSTRSWSRFGGFPSSSTIQIGKRSVGGDVPSGSGVVSAPTSHLIPPIQESVSISAMSQPVQSPPY